MQLIPADQFTFEQLTEAYNQTRIDYLVPMPMNVARLREYVAVYDVDLSASCVVVEDGNMLALGMLGVREGRGWITRLGVLPAGRRLGTGSRVMEWLLRAAAVRRLKRVWLEVIKGNQPGYHLFCKYGFNITRELLVARRPPNPRAPFLTHESHLCTTASATSISPQESVDLLTQRRQRPNWLNEAESMQNVSGLNCLLVELEDGGQGWVSYQPGLLQLTRINVEVTSGDPAAVTTAVLQLLHRKHSSQDAIIENLPEDCPVWPGFVSAGYFETFRRIEMVREMEPTYS
jgi:ribosomal protein S18 acetylase RimI-like enzyme